MLAKQKKMRMRIFISLIFLVSLMILSRCLEIPQWILAILFAIPYGVAGYDILWIALKNIRNGNVFDENFLMAIATLAAFFVGEYPEGAAVMIFYQVGELFQSVAVGKSRASIAQLMSIAPDFANVEINGEIKTVDPEEVEIGSTIVIRAGEKIPLDGEVLSGESFVDTAALTGESVPRKIVAGNFVVSGCINGEGILRVRTTKVYDDSTVAKILELVENASEKKAKMEKFITRFARYYTPIVTVAAVLLAVIPPIFLGASREVFYDWILRACTFLIVSCPCALVISVPLGFFGGIGAASRIGVLVKGANSLEMAAQLKTLVFDKTGTLTKGEFRVNEMHPAKNFSAENLLELAALGESFSTHPIAKSILKAYGKKPAALRVQKTAEIAGEGIRAIVDNKELLLGSALLLQKNQIEVQKIKSVGTIVYVAFDGKFVGSLVISDSLKEGAISAMQNLKNVGVENTVMLTGDSLSVAENVAQTLKINSYFAELLPADKVSKMENLLQNSTAKNRIGFVGDGINDAPVLMRADVGFAMGAFGSDAAMEAADIVLMDDDVRKIPQTISIAKRTQKIVTENVVFALSVKGIILLLGACGFANMWLAVFGDVGVTVLAIFNSMRMLRQEKKFTLHSSC